MLERERLIEIGASIASVALMIGILSLIGHQYMQDGEFGDAGGLMLIVAITLFVVLMAGLGYVLAYTVTTQEAETATD